MRNLPKPVAIGSPRKGNNLPFSMEVGHPIGDYPEKNPVKVQHFLQTSSLIIGKHRYRSDVRFNLLSVV